MSTTPKHNTGDVEQLREQFLTLGSCIGPYDSPHRCSALHCDHCGLCDISEEVLDLISVREAEAKRKGYDLALDKLIEWNESWRRSSSEPFNWHGAAEVLKENKDMFPPFDQLTQRQERSKDGDGQRKN